MGQKYTNKKKANKQIKYKNNKDYNNNINQCYEKKNEIGKEISLLFNDAKKKEKHKVVTEKEVHYL